MDILLTAVSKALKCACYYEIWHDLEMRVKRHRLLAIGVTYTLSHGRWLLHTVLELTCKVLVIKILI